MTAATFPHPGLARPEPAIHYAVVVYRDEPGGEPHLKSALATVAQD